MTQTIRDDLVENYEAAKRLVERLAAAWEAEGWPLTTLGGTTGKTLVAHPVLTQLQVARRDVDKFARTLGVGKQAHRGPAPSAVVSASIGKAPSASVTPIRRKRG